VRLSAESRYVVSPANQLHHVLGITRSGGDADRGDFGDLFQVVIGQFHFCRCNIFLEIFPLLGAGDGNDVFALGQHPGQCELPNASMAAFKS